MIFSAFSDIGRRRKQNEDSIYISYEAIGRFSNLFILADGMGGLSDGQYASKKAIEYILDYIKYAEGAVLATMREAIEYANEKLYVESNIQKPASQMGTTIVLCTIADNTLYIANIGDSRLYMIEDTMQQITHDHSYSEEMFRKGRIEKFSKEYLANRHKLTRAVGIEEKVAIDIFEAELTDNATILLCSDGLYNMVSEKDILRIVHGDMDFSKKAKALVDEANRNGGNDNISVILVRQKGREEVQ